MTKGDVYESVTARIVAALEEGTVPWHKPWTAGGVPVSLSTGKPYRGVNTLLLGLESYADPRWGTYKAIAAAGGQVRKGEHGTKIILWKPAQKRFTETDSDGNETEGSAGYLFLRCYTVFNASQADGLPELELEVWNEHEVNDRAEALVAGYKAAPAILHGSDSASYSPSRDMVRMPDPETFESSSAYYQTLLHELVHSTGHESRLNRLEPATFGTDPYAREELIAELGASMLAGLVGLETSADAQSASYIAHWIERFKQNPKLIVNSAAQAQKASDRIAGETFAGETFERVEVAA